VNNQNGSAKVYLIVFLLLAALAGAGVYYAAAHYVVTSERGRVILPKRFLTFEDTCTDIRGWTYETSQKHQEVCLAIQKAGFGDLLPKPPSFGARMAAGASGVKESAVGFWSKAKQKIHNLTGSSNAVVVVTNVVTVPVPAK
jgi:hypothetical protein